MYRAFVIDERGQILPLLVVLMILLIGGGVLVMWLGLSTTIETKAQTAADAAALAGEQELVTELETPHYGPNGQLLPPTYDPATVCAKAQGYATDNHGSMSCPGDISFPSSSGGLFAPDVLVTVHSQQTLPNGSIKPGAGGTAQARASTDPYSQDSPPITTTTISCDASVISGDPFNPPADTGKAPGFFAKSGTNYTFGCEPKLAGRIEALAKAKGLHLVGVLGYDTSAPATGLGSSDQPGPADQIAQAHACGAASKVDGLPKPGARGEITDATLRSFGLTQPFPGAPDEIELAGTSGCQQQVSTAAGQSQPVGLGNSDVHLVPLNGGPAGSGLSFALPGAVAQPNLSQMQLGCIIYQVDQQLHVDAKVLLSTFMAAWTESTMRNITSYTPGEGSSLGLYQQQATEGWGTPEQETNPATATEMFLLGTGPGTPFYPGNNGDEGAIAVDAAHPEYTPWFLTEQVQHSKFLDGSNYLAQMGTAQNMIDQIKGGACKNQ